MLRERAFVDGFQDRLVDDSCPELAMNEETFRAFYDRTARGLWGYLSRVTGDRQLADDLLQETFYRFLRANGRYESEIHRRNSLYRIATNLARDARRRSLTRLPWNLSGTGVEGFIASGDMQNTELTTDVSRAMAQLKPRERAMLWLAYAEGASHREIAEILGLRPASLKAMLFRARRALAALLVERSKGGKR